MWGARILTMMLLFNFFTVLLGFHNNTILNKVLILNDNGNNVVVSKDLTNSIQSSLTGGSGVIASAFSSISPLAYIWNFLMFLLGTLLAPVLIFGYGLPAIYSVPIFIVWFTTYLFAFISLIRGVSF